MRFFILAPFVAVLLAGCSDDLVVVLPAADGHIGGVVVQTGDGRTVVLDKAYASDHPGDRKAAMAVPEEVSKEFSDVLTARPIPPQTYRLSFLFGSDELTPESSGKFAKVFEEVGRRQAAEIVIIGHTDTVGNLRDNDDLSLKRAEAIKNRFQALERERQPPPDLTIRTAGRGKRDAKIADNTNSEDERYVEITVQ